MIPLHTMDSMEPLNLNPIEPIAQSNGVIRVTGQWHRWIKFHIVLNGSIWWFYWIQWHPPNDPMKPLEVWSLNGDGKLEVPLGKTSWSIKIVPFGIQTPVDVVNGSEFQ